MERRKHKLVLEIDQQNPEKKENLQKQNQNPPTKPG